MGPSNIFVVEGPVREIQVCHANLVLRDSGHGAQCVPSTPFQKKTQEVQGDRGALSFTYRKGCAWEGTLGIWRLDGR